jgi:hypothetical protein
VFPQVLAAVQAHLPLERRAFTEFHDQEHQQEYLGNDKLAEWFDRLVHRSRSRRRIWLDYCFCNDSAPNPDVAQPNPAVEDEASAILSVKDLLTELQVGYINIFTIATNVLDYHAITLARACLIDGKVRVPGQNEARKIHGVEPDIRKAEVLLEQITKQGRGVWQAHEAR